MDAIVNYADDFVTLCRRNAAQAMQAMREIMQKLKLTVNETKTRQCRVPDETFNFLGYTIGRCYLRRTGHAYISSWPSVKKVKGLRASLSAMTRRSSTGLSVEEMVGKLNETIRGWANYFRLGSVHAAYQAVMHHACRRLRQWLGRKSGARVGLSRCPDKYLHATLGLIDLVQARKAYRLS